MIKNTLFKNDKCLCKKVFKCVFLTFVLKIGLEMKKKFFNPFFFANIYLYVQTGMSNLYGDYDFNIFMKGKRIITALTVIFF